MGLLIAFMGLALYLRIYLPYHQVFTDNGTKFTTNDAYYHMRIVDTIVHNFPDLMRVDPYMVFGGAGIDKPNLWQYLIAGIAWIAGLGSPTRHTVDVVAVYLPAILAALTVIPVYVLGRELLGRWAGIIAAGLIAVFSGEFLGRSILGNTDYHVAEVFFTTMALMFLLLAIKAARQRQLSFDHIRRRDWSTLRRPLVYSGLAGLFLGMYLDTWPGALLFVFIITVYFIIQSVIDHLSGRDTDYLSVVGVALWLAALAVFLPTLPGAFNLVPLLAALLIPLGLPVLSIFMKQRRVHPGYYPLSLVALGLAGFGMFRLVAPSLLNSMTREFRLFFAYGPGGFGAATTETRPFLAPDGYFSFYLPWGSFTTSFFLGIAGLIIMTNLVFKRGDISVSLIAVWSLIILAATLGQRRYAYYLAVNLAVLSGYLCCQAARLLNARGLLPQRTRTRGKDGNRKTAGTSKGAGTVTVVSPVFRGVGVLAVVFAVLYPNIGPMPGGDRFAIDTARAAHFAPSDAWQTSLLWLKDNTPEPFGDPDSYYRLYDAPEPGQSFRYPGTAYGVLAWWDFGYWITRIAQRIPNTSPAHQAPAIDAARFFLTSDDGAAGEILEKLHTRYIIIDFATAIQFLPTIFEGQAVTGGHPVVISYRDRIDSHGNAYKDITDAREFPSYEEAEKYVSAQKTGNYRIVGIDPFVSPAPLDASTHYRLVHLSKQGIRLPGGGGTAEVKIFEYTRTIYPFQLLPLEVISG